MARISPVGLDTLVPRYSTSRGPLIEFVESDRLLGTDSAGRVSRPRPYRDRGPPEAVTADATHLAGRSRYARSSLRDQQGPVDRVRRIRPSPWHGLRWSSKPPAAVSRPRPT